MVLNVIVSESVLGSKPGGRVSIYAAVHTYNPETGGGPSVRWPDGHEFADGDEVIAATRSP